MIGFIILCAIAGAFVAYGGYLTLGLCWACIQYVRSQRDEARARLNRVQKLAVASAAVHAEFRNARLHGDLIQMQLKLNEMERIYCEMKSAL